MDLQPEDNDPKKPKADKLGFLQKVAEVRGKVPSAISEKPPIDRVTAWYLDAFHLLSNSRSVGFGVGPIPLSEITNYGLVFDTIHDLNSFCQIISRIDAAYIKKLTSKQKSKNSKG